MPVSHFVLSMIFDFTASPAQLGKPVLSDLVEGKVTLPLIYARSDCRGPQIRLRQFWKKKTHRALEQITEPVHKPARLTARALAHEFGRARKNIAECGANTEYGRALMSVPDFILARDS